MAGELIQHVAIALGLGLLVGLQREWSTPQIAGIRTFALITMFGAVCGAGDGWFIAAGLAAVTALVIFGNYASMKTEQYDHGITTEVAALVMFGVGAMIAADLVPAALVVAGLVAVLLHWKEPLHHFVEAFNVRDLRAIIQVTLIALVILPVLPNETYGPYGVLNPFKIWLMVVLICGISLLAYMGYKFLGAKVGTLLGGVFGGLISSTATTVSFARRSRNTPETAPLAALVIMIASTIVFVRVAVEVAMVAPVIFVRILPPLALMGLFMAVVCAVLYMRERTAAKEIPVEGDPSDLKAALVFGALYALVLFAVAAAKDHFGDSGLFIVAVVSGLTDVDAITLSTSQMMKDGGIAVDTGWRMILVGVLSNLVFKGAAVAALGSRRLLGYIVVLFGVSLAFGAGLLLLWPNIGE